MTAPTPAAPFPILKTVDEVRAWRNSLGSGKEGEVGMVPTMGALHEGHLSLVRASLEQNAHTIVSIFVNPAQFAPHEDLSTYPRTLASDLSILSSLSVDSKKLSALFLPPVEALYPSGITTEVSKQRGTFVEVKGLQDVMEGVSRPGFFRGVATVVLKLFNIVHPTRAYFGQKDIQQAILLRRLCTDLHLSHPFPQNLIIQPTFRSTPQTGLALSSRNAYLRPEEREWANVLIDALKEGERVWNEQRRTAGGEVKVDMVLEVAREWVRKVEKQAQEKGVEVELIYFSLNDCSELTDLEKELGRDGGLEKGKGAILSGAVRLGKTRLIDNLVFDFELN